jgi:endonuclease III
MRNLAAKVGGRYSQEMGIDPSNGNREEIFKWFLASVLFGARMSETVVRRTLREFAKADVLSPEGILKTGWNGLVQILDRGGYARYDLSTASKLLDISKAIAEQYGGDLNRLHESAESPRDLESRLKSLAKGVGDATVNIFLREMRGIWQKAASLPSDQVVMAARNIGFISEELDDKQKVLAHLMRKWTIAGKRAKDFPAFEVALARIAKNYCRRNACAACLVRADCWTAKKRGREAAAGVRFRQDHV